MNHEAARNMGKGLRRCQSVGAEGRGGRLVASSHIAHSGSVRANAAPRPRCAGHDRRRRRVKRWDGSQSETQLAGAAGISSKSRPRPAARLSDFFPTGKHLCTYNPGLIFSGTLCTDFGRRKLERRKGDKDVETEPGLFLQNLSPAPSSSEAYTEGNL